jgi:hypothetical protein
MLQRLLLGLHGCVGIEAVDRPAHALEREDDLSHRNKEGWLVLKARKRRKNLDLYRRRVARAARSIGTR